MSYTHEQNLSDRAVLERNLELYGRAYYYCEDDRRKPLDPTKVGVIDRGDTTQPAIPLAEFARLIMGRGEYDALTVTIFNALHKAGYKIVKADPRLDMEGDADELLKVFAQYGYDFQKEMISPSRSFDLSTLPDEIK
jgi:hypothetical protein